MSTGPALTVYFDGACPLCSREIGYYQRCRGADAIAWVDVAAIPDMPPDLDRAAALARFHVRRPDGTLVSGAAGFAALWRALPGFALLGRLASFPPVIALGELAYRLFLPLRARLLARYRRRAVAGGEACGCGGDAVSPPPPPGPRP